MFALLLSPNIVPTHICHTALTALVWQRQEMWLYLLKTSRRNILQAGDDPARGKRLKHPTRRCGEVRKEAKRWGQSKSTRCRLSLWQAHYRMLLAQIRGLWIHMWIYPRLNFQQKGQLAGIAKPRHRGHMPRVNLLVGSPDTRKGGKGGSCSPFFECMWINIYICVFGSLPCYFAQLYLESMFLGHF